MVDAYHPQISAVTTLDSPNHVNLDAHGPGLIIVGIILATIGISIVSIRLYARAFITRALGIDDILIVFATIFAVALTVLNIIANIIYYSGRHVWDIPPSSFLPHRINIWISQICVTLALSLTKISILFFYRRLSVSFTKAFYIAAWVGIIYNILYIIAFILAICLICHPTKAFWMSFDFGHNNAYPYLSSCGNERAMDPLTAVFSTISDIYTALLPMILISRLDLPSAQKQALYFLFGLAFLVVIIGIIRIVYLYIMVADILDFTWTLWKVWILTQVEMWLAIYVASAPALKPLTKRLGSAVGQRLTATRERSAMGTRKSVTTKKTNGSSIAEVVQLEGFIVMSNGAVTNSINGLYCTQYDNNEAKAQDNGNVRPFSTWGHQWAREARRGREQGKSKCKTDIGDSE